MYLVVMERGAYCQAYEFDKFSEALEFARYCLKREAFCCPNKKVRFFNIATEYAFAGDKLSLKNPPK